MKKPLAIFGLRLAAEGFECVSSHFDSEQQEPVIYEPEHLEDCPPPYGSPAQDAAVGLTVEIPLDMVVLGNLTNLLDAKGSLIKKAYTIPATNDCVVYESN